MKSKITHLLGYVPFFSPTDDGENRPEDIVFRPDYVAKINAGIEKANFDACGWIELDRACSPIFITKHADELYAHINAWTQNHPEDWFTLYYHRKDQKYCMILWPDTTKSIERYKFNAAMWDLSPLADNPEVIQHPLIFRSKSSTSFDDILIRMGEKWTAKVGFTKTVPTEESPDQVILFLPPLKIEPIPSALVSYADVQLID